MSTTQAPQKGQLVIIHEDTGSYSTGRVERTTATQVVLENGGRYHLDNGRQVGSAGRTRPARASWSGEHNWPAYVDGLRAQRHRRAVALQAKRLGASPLSPLVLRDVAAELMNLAAKLEAQAEDARER